MQTPTVNVGLNSQPKVSARLHPAMTLGSHPFAKPLIQQAQAHLGT
jgi:hypothetical protein